MFSLFLSLSVTQEIAFQSRGSRVLSSTTSSSSWFETFFDISILSACASSKQAALISCDANGSPWWRLPLQPIESARLERFFFFFFFLPDKGLDYQRPIPWLESVAAQLGRKRRSETRLSLSPPNKALHIRRRRPTRQLTNARQRDRVARGS